MDTDILDYMQAHVRACVCVCARAQSLHCVWFFVTPWTVAHQTPLSIGYSRQAYWSGFPFPTPGDLLNPGTEPVCPAFSALLGGFFATEPPRLYARVIF